MIKQKAPKDMTATEFVAHLELVASREMLSKNLEGWAITLQGLRKELSEPAPNPFTPDQITVMQEFQRDGYNYAAKSRSGVVCVFKSKPVRSVTHANAVTGETFGRWVDTELPFEVTSFEFLKKATNWDDPEPLCFADYAPMEEK